METRRSYKQYCGIARALDVIGERWALLIVRELLLGPKRFNDLLSGLAGASPNVITQRLRELADSGVVLRRDLGPPSHVHVYELTDWGQELEPLVHYLGRWGASAPLPAGAKLGVDSLLLSLKLAFDPAAAPNNPVSYELSVDGDTYTVYVSDIGLDVRRGSPDSSSATLYIDRETFEALVQGRRTAADALRGSEIRATGARAAAAQLLDLLFGSFARQRVADAVER